MITITVARKPISEGNVASNVLKHGTGGLDIDPCRIAYPSGKPESGWAKSGSNGEAGYIGTSTFRIRTCSAEEIQERVAGGRWPANLILQHLPGCLCVGKSKVRSNGRVRHKKAPDGMFRGLGGNPGVDGHADADGMESIYAYQCEPGCPVTALDDASLAGGMHSAGTARNKVVDKDQYAASSYMVHGPTNMRRLGDEGGASRFFKQVGGGKP